MFNKYAPQYGIKPEKHTTDLFPSIRGQAMPYVTRNKSGEIINISSSQQQTHEEWLDHDSPEVLEFLHIKASSEQVKQALSTSDNEMLRVIEDLVDLLLEKQVFVFTELPFAVQEKLQSRKQLRQNMQSLSNLIAEDETIFPDY